MARDGSFYTYIMASKSGVLYVGVTNNLVVRVGQHKDQRVSKVHQSLQRDQVGVVRAAF
ncbi:MAG TPA: GIY-YIG nuclease family protein [Methylomirabilota bacterium]|nr:GIY-YIG nuclease family protein [Methylomirabilota bacterium]